MRVALAMHPHAMLLETAIAAEVLGVDRSDLSPSGTWYDLVVCTADGSPHPWLPGHPTADWEALADAEVVVLPSTDDPAAPTPPRLLTALRTAHERGRRVAALCTGAFLLAEAGLLDGRSATTHWMHADDLRRRHPRVDVRPDVLYVEDGGVLTSAGKTAALDLCLHLVRRDLGAAAANGLARRLVTPAHRPGGQAQFIAPPAAPSGSGGLTPTLEWARGRLHHPLTVADLAREAGMSSRHLGRRMRAEVGAAPLDWLQQQRLARAQELLESTDATVDQVATRCGLGPTALRRLFHRTLGTSPTAYRATFRAGTG